VRVDIDTEAIARAMKMDKLATLPSGRTLQKVAAETIEWLNSQAYIYTATPDPAKRVTLATKGLAAMNAVPSGLQQTLGTTLVEAAASPDPPSAMSSRVGDFFGSLAGGFTKSIMGS